MLLDAVFGDPTSHVHELVAQDMEQTVKDFPLPSAVNERWMGECDAVDFGRVW